MPRHPLGEGNRWDGKCQAVTCFLITVIELGSLVLPSLPGLLGHELRDLAREGVSALL
jgi:hypothetical protein